MAAGKGKESRAGMDSGKYVRYTEKQVEALERVYRECPKPNSFRRQQLLRECPILSNIEPKQIKVWFQNRRCREKQRKESTRLLALNEKLTAMNRVLVKQNDNLSQQALQLLRLNHDLRRQLKILKDKTITSSETKDEDPSAKAGAGCRTIDRWRKRPTPQPPAWDANPARLMALAEECLSEFLAKATGTGIDWVQIPGMKPGPDSIGIVGIGLGCEGVASRACSLIGMESSRVSDVLKDRISWLPDCHRMEIIGIFTTSSGATVELLYSQMYSPTCLTKGRDFCTLRYTTVLEDRNLVVCERSLDLATMPPNEGFIRAEMLSSGYLIRPCASVGSIVYIVDHLDLKAECAPEVLRPVYQSSAAIAQKVTVVALRHLRSLAQEAAGEAVTGGTLHPAAIRALSHRISRSFNDAVNSFAEDGWVLLANEGTEDVSLALNASWDPQVTGSKCMPSSLLSAGYGDVLCAKASMLLQNVPPAAFVCFLRERRSEWIDIEIDSSCTEFLRTHVYGASALAGAEIGRREVPMPLAHSVEHEEIMELVKFEGHSSSREGSLLSKETYLLQLCSGVDETVLGASAQLVFTPVDGALSDDIPLLPSGFRVTPLDNSLMDGFDSFCCSKEPSTHEVSSDVDNTKTEDLPNALRSIVSIVFQFGYESRNHDSVITAARKYTRAIVASLQRLAVAIAPRVGSTLALKKPSAPTEVLDLVKQIVAGYRINFGAHPLWKHPLTDEDLLRAVWQHSDAVICLKCESPLKVIFANEAALSMLETASVDLQDLIWDQTLHESERKNSDLVISKILQRGFAYFPAGIRFSRTGRGVAYERAMAWKVPDQNEETPHVAFMFINCSL